jgi:ankyrin repeat protein
MSLPQLHAFISSWRSLQSACVEGGFSPLTLAVSEGFPEAVKVIVELGADVNSPDESGMTPILRALKLSNSADMEGSG